MTEITEGMTFAEMDPAERIRRRCAIAKMARTLHSMGHLPSWRSYYNREIRTMVYVAKKRFGLWPHR